MAQVTLQVKPYKLKPTDETSLTRDDFITWKYNLQSFLRQKTEWAEFMPGGEHSEWTCLDENDTRGLSVDPTDQSRESIAEAREKTLLLRGNNEDFLTCVATFCPSGFYEFVIRESTSLQWIYDQILTTYNLQTQRQDILNGSEMEFKFDDKFTYQHAYIQLKDFYMSALLPRGSVWKGKTLTSAETLTPLAESLIIEKWLSKIHPSLPAHVKKTRGHLFNAATPTLGCNQQELCKQIDIMINEIEKDQETAAAVGRLSFSNTRWKSNSFQFTPRSRGGPNFNFNNRGSTRFNNPRTSTSASPCQLCLQAGKPEYIARTHSMNQCQSFQPRSVPPSQQKTPAMRLIAAPIEDHGYQQFSGDNDFGNYENYENGLNNYHNYVNNDYQNDPNVVYGAPSSVPFSSDQNPQYSIQQE